MKALVIYGTRGGATRQIAEAIGEELGRQGYTAAVRNAKETGGLDVGEYDLIVVGSSVIMTMWKRQATAFLKRNVRALASKKVALFSSGLAGGDPALADYCRQRMEKVAAKFPSIKPIGLAYFGSYLDFASKSRIDRFFGAVKKDMEKKGFDTSRPIDQRDWTAIRAWARSLADRNDCKGRAEDTANAEV